jgi:hypothetical protein
MQVRRRQSCALATRSQMCGSGTLDSLPCQISATQLAVVRHQACLPCCALPGVLERRGPLAHLAPNALCLLAVIAHGARWLGASKDFAIVDVAGHQSWAFRGFRCC